MKVFRVSFFLLLTHVLPGNLWFWHLHAGASGGPSCSFSCSFFSFFTELPTCDRTAGMCFQRQSQGVVGRTEIGSSGFRMCTFMQIFNMMIYLFSKFHLLFFGSDGVLHLWMVMPFLVDKNGDRFHKETVYLSLSGGFKHFWKFHTYLKEDEPILTFAYFSDLLVQPSAISLA